MREDMFLYIFNLLVLKALSGKKREKETAPYDVYSEIVNS